MIKRCNNCNVKIPFIAFYRQFLKNRYSYTCLECSSIHKVTVFSIIVSTILFLIVLAYLYTEIYSEKNLLLFIAWILIHHLIVQPFILKYNKKS